MPGEALVRQTPIDVWSIGSFDAELRSLLDLNRGLLIDYATADREATLNREASNRTVSLPNSYAAAYMYFLEEQVLPVVATRTMRAWHYTRLMPRSPP